MTNQEALQKAVELWPLKNRKNDTVADLEINLFYFEGKYCEGFWIGKRNPYSEMDETWGDGDSWDDAFETALKRRPAKVSV